MGEPEAIAALERSGLATSGPVRLFHATSAVVAAAIEADGTMPGDDAEQVWLASSEKIAPLHHAAGATGAAEEGEKMVEVLLEVEVDARELFFERTAHWDEEPVELFYLLAPGEVGFAVKVLASRRWPGPEEGGPFTMHLEFGAECCPQCGEPREPGLCPRCGIEIGESTEVAEMAAARHKALGSVEAELQALVERFEELPQGSIVVSNDQFATVVSDAEIFERIGEMVVVGNELETLNLNDRAVIGAELREKMSKRVARVEELAQACEELALFDPAGPAAELRTLASESGRYGARLTQAFVAILVAETIRGAREAEAEMQRLLGDFPFKGRIGELLAEMWDWMVPDFDARAALVLGRPGNYSDKYGFLDIGAVFGAFAREEKPLTALALCGRRYFSHLIGDGAVREEALESFLAVAAIGLATLDRPLAAHRIARWIYELLEEASQAAPEEVQGVVERTIGEAELIFEALEQIKRGVVLLAAGEEAGTADDGAVLKTVVEAYKELAETSFRTYGRLVLDLERLKRGEAASEGADPPMLGNLSEALEASSEPTAGGLVAASDTALRNACGHSQYRWDEEAEEVVDMRTAQRWSLEELDASVAAMSAAIAGADAGYSCFLTAEGTRVEVPSWARGGTGSLAAIVARANFSSRGFQVVEVGDRGLTVTIDDGDELDKMSLMSTLGGITVCTEADQAVRVLGASGRVLLDVEVAAFRQASEAKVSFKDLAILIPFFSNAVRTHGNREKALAEWVTVMVNQVITTAAVDVDPAAMLAVADRFGYVLDFARGQDCDAGEKLALALKGVARCRALAFASARGDGDTAARFAEELLALNEWVGESGVVWPPRF